MTAELTFVDRFSLGAALLMDELDEGLADELELFTRVELPSAVAFADHVDIVIAGHRIGSLSRRWLETGDGAPIFRPDESSGA